MSRLFSTPTLILLVGWWIAGVYCPLLFACPAAAAIFGGSAPAIFANLLGPTTSATDDQGLPQQQQQRGTSSNFPDSRRGPGNRPLRSRSSPPPPQRQDGSAVSSAQLHSQQQNNSSARAQQQATAASSFPGGQYKQVPPPPPPTGGDDPRHHQRTGDRSSSSPSWKGPPPPPPIDASRASYSHQPGPWSFPPPGGDPYFSQYAVVEAELGQSLQREQELLGHLHNLTITLTGLEQRDEIHLRQLDVLTERVMEVEATSSRERNLLLEYQANCTALGKQIALLGGQVEEWQSRCNALMEQHDADETEKRDIKQNLKVMSLKAEELAALIERYRLEEDDDLYSSRKRAKKKKRKASSGFFAWLFGSNYDNDEIDDREDMYDEARSTLLEALQRERNNVDDLENVVANLQQNNSAMADQVASRDIVIAELNDRVAVFEEDNTVLKAALRQLKKEISEEAPKTQKLANELREARAEITRLQNQIESITIAHKKEIAALNKVISQKQATIIELESNLTMIGTYVDKLEERLTDFAVARRDLQDREQEYEKAVNASAVANTELELVKGRVKELESDQTELKVLLEELAMEREKLKGECLRLSTERDVVRKDLEILQQSVEVLNGERIELTEQSSFWKFQAENLGRDLNLTISTNHHLQEQLNSTNSDMAELLLELNGSILARNQLQGWLSSAEARNEALEAKLEEMQTQVSWSESNRTKLLETKIQELEDALRASTVRNESSITIPNASSVFVENVTMTDQDIPLDSHEVHIGNASLVTTNTVVLETNKSEVPSDPQQIMFIPQQVEAKRNTTLVPHSLNHTTLSNTTARVPMHNTTLPKRKVPFRKIRKALAKITGVHGLFTRPSHPRKPRARPSTRAGRGVPPPQQNKTATSTKVPPPPVRTAISSTGLPPRPLPNTLPASGANSAPSTTASTPPQ